MGLGNLFEKRQDKILLKKIEKLATQLEAKEQVLNEKEEALKQKGNQLKDRERQHRVIGRKYC